MRRARRAAVLLAFGLLVVAPGMAWGSDLAGHIDHVQSKNAGVDLLFSVSGLPTGVAPDLTTVAVTVDGQRVQATAKATAQDSGRIRRTAILAIDVSESMAGTSFDQAKAAAHTFIDRAPADLYVGIVAFASDVSVVSRPTTDRGAVNTAVDGLQLSEQTSLYAGVTRAVAAAGGSGLRSIVVLTDGRDTTDAELGGVIDAVSASRARVDVVALGRDGPSRSALEDIAAAGHGSVIDASEPEALTQVFADEAAAIAGQVLISFPVPPSKAGAEASIEVSVEAGGTTFTDSAVVGLSDVPTVQPSAPAISVATPGRAVGAPVLIGGLAVLVIGIAILLLVAFGMFNVNESSKIERRLAVYGPNSAITVTVPSGKGEAGVKAAAISAAERALGNGNLSVNLARKLDAAGLPFTSAEWLLLHIGVALTAALVGMVLSGGGLLATLLFLVIGAALPWAYVNFKRGRRLKRFQGQLAPTLQVMSGSLSAGLSLAQSVETVVREGSEPISGEFRRALIEQRLGVEVEDALDGVAKRMESKDFGWMVMAVRIQREVGGNLAELLNTVSSTLREREYLRRQVSTLSAEGRLSGWIIGGLPPVFVIYLMLVRPEYLTPMLQSSLGLMMIGIAVVMMVMGALWLRKTVQIEV